MNSVSIAGRNHTDRRPRAVLLAVLSIVVLGYLISILPLDTRPAPTETLDPRTDPAAHERQARGAEIRSRFQQAVMMLHAKQYEHAITVLHRLLELAPRMPEASCKHGLRLTG